MPTRTPTTPHASQKEAAPKRVVTPSAAQKASVLANEVSTIDLQQVAADPRTARPAEILMLQRKCGNQAVTHLIQAKPQIGPASASGAQEADRAAEQASAAPALQEEVQHPNENGLPPDLKTSIETLSGFALDDVQVHRNSQQPAKLRAYAYAQGAEIHLGPGQEDQLPHEAWHI